MALDAMNITIIGNKKGDQNAVDKRIENRGGALVSVLWKGFALVFLANFSDETTDVEESGATAVFFVSSGSSPQKPDCQPSGRTQNDYAGNGEADNVKGSIRRTATISGEDVDWLRWHRRIRVSGVGG